MTPYAPPLAVLLLACPLAAQELNRLQLDNGGELLSWLNDPFVGGDPEAGDFTGDFYWKVFPGEVLRSSSGTLELMGIEYVVFDQDWDLDDAHLWAWSFTRGVDSGDVGGGGSGAAPGSIEPWFADPEGFLVPDVPGAGLGNPEGPGGCPAPDEISGWVVTETWEDPLTGEPVPMAVLQADGATDYVYTGFFPGGQSVTFGGANCGGGGNATFQFLASMDVPSDPEGGENAPDVLGTGYSPYGGRHFGDASGSGFHVHVPHPHDRGAALALFFREPMLNVYVDAGLDGTGPELGLAALDLPVGLDGSGGPTGTVARLGWQIHSAGALGAPARFGVAFGTFAEPLPAPGLPLYGGQLLLLPGAQLFVQSAVAWGMWPFDPVGDGEAVATADPVPVPAAPALVDAAVWMQGFDLDLDALTLRETQVSRVVFRAND